LCALLSSFTANGLYITSNDTIINSIYQAEASNGLYIYSARSVSFSIAESEMDVLKSIIDIGFIYEHRDAVFEMVKKDIYTSAATNHEITQIMNNTVNDYLITSLQYSAFQTDRLYDFYFFKYGYRYINIVMDMVNFGLKV
jgi:hypothetical protein